MDNIIPSFLILLSALYYYLKGFVFLTSGNIFMASHLFSSTCIEKIGKEGLNRKWMENLVLTVSVRQREREREESERKRYAGIVIWWIKIN